MFGKHFIIIKFMIVRACQKVVRASLCHRGAMNYNAYGPVDKGKMEQLRQLSKILVGYNKKIATTPFTSEKSLYQTLLERPSGRQAENLPHDDPTKQGLAFKQHCLDQAEKFFRPGIELDEDIFTQRRMILPQTKNRDQSFWFFPTKSVTTPLFEKLFRSSKGDLLIYGNYGVSKTSSLVLYCHFSSIINRYLYLCGREQQEAFRESLGADRKYIPRKVFYWSMEPIWDETQEVKQLKRIFLQAPELEIDPSQIKKMLLWTIEQKYQEKNIRCQIIFDQINSIAAGFRQANKLYMEEQKEEAKQYLKPYQKALYFHNSFTWPKIYNSSVDIEQDLLYTKRTMSATGIQYKYKMNFSDHQKIQGFFINYSEYHGTQQRKDQLIDFMLKELESQLPPDRYKKIRALKQKISGDFPDSYLVRPHIIFEAVSDSIESLGSQCQPDKLIQTILEMIERSCISKFKELLKRFFQKAPQDDRRKFARIVFNYLLRQSKQKNQIFILDVFPNFYKDKQQNQNTIQMGKEGVVLSKELFSLIQREKRHYIKVHCSASDLEKILRANRRICQEMISWQQQHIRIQYEKNRAVFGWNLQNSFKQAMKESKHPILKLGNQVMPIKAQSTFRHFNQISMSSIEEEEKQGILKDPLLHMEDLIRTCVQHPNQFVYADPINKPQKNKKDQSSTTSASIDFMIVRLDKSSDRLIIYSFDMGTSGDDKNIKKKMNDQNVYKYFCNLKYHNLKRSPEERTFTKLSWHKIILAQSSVVQKLKSQQVKNYITLFSQFKIKINYQSPDPDYECEYLVRNFKDFELAHDKQEDQYWRPIYEAGVGKMEGK